MTTFYQDFSEITTTDDDEFGGGHISLEQLTKRKSQAVKVDGAEEDEFGGGRISLEKLNGRKPQAVKVDGAEEDDEFGGGRISLEKLNGRKPQAVEADEAEDDDDDDDDYDDEEDKEIERNTKQYYIELGKRKKKLRKTLGKSKSGNPEAIYGCDHEIFSVAIQNNQWYIDREDPNSMSKTIHQYDEECGITIPVVVDTEFHENKVKVFGQQKRTPLTAQVGGIHSEAQRSIFSYSSQVDLGRELANLPPLPKVKSDFVVVDYLTSLGLEVTTEEATDSFLKELPKCYVVVYAHFATAELNIIFDGTIKERIKYLQRSKGDEQITNGRRIYCQTTFKQKGSEDTKLDWVSLKHIISINGYQYELRLKIIDTGAIHGVASFKDFAQAVDWKLRYKDNFTSKEKGEMDTMVIERAKDFENYALGDLDVYEALDSFDKKWKEVYEILDLIEYYQTPKLTIGGTVKDLFEANLAKIHQMPAEIDGISIWKEYLSLMIVDRFIKPTSANDLRLHSVNTRALLAKVEGGRCRNNRPTDIFVKRKIKGKYDANLICDIDISGCYDVGQRNQGYYFGIPEIFDYEAVTNNDYIPLGQYLEDYGVNIEALKKAVAEGDIESFQNPENWGELMSGAWYARIKTSTKLEYAQDYFASWFTETNDRVDLLAKSIRAMRSDTEMVSTDWVDFDEDCGSLKIFNHEIWNGVLTHDGLQWIFAVRSARQRSELFEKIQIMSSAVYPRSQQITEGTPKEMLQKLCDAHKEWEGRNTTKRIKENGRTKIRRDSDKCHAWYSINLGELFIDKLLIERKKAKALYGSKSPLQTLFKLCVNTSYGDMVSKYFVTSNSVVGNNITARARSLAWYMEKGFHGWRSVTGGCAFELNGVMYKSRDNINGETVNQHRKGSQLERRKIKRAPMGGAQEILGYWVEYKEYSENKPEGFEIKHALGLKVDDEDMPPIIKPDKNHEGCEVAKSPCLDWINTTAMEHLQQRFPLVNVLHNTSTSIELQNQLETIYKPRTGQFSFEVKDIYHSGAFHGSANYVLVNPNGQNLKARGYEVKREHQSYEGETLAEGDGTTFAKFTGKDKVYKSNRYNEKNSPAKDLTNQLIDNPEAVKRQVTAIKKQILKVGDYKNLAEKYDEMGVEAGDPILKPLLMQEFSLSQFTFQTYNQYMMWKEIVNHCKNVDRQSFEGNFLNADGTLNFITMCDWIDERIAEGVEMPFDILCEQKYKSNSRAIKKTTKRQVKYRFPSISHPSLENFTLVKEAMKTNADNEST